MESEKIVVFETVVDHLTGEEIGSALSCLNAHPVVLDAAYFPGIGKKNRPVGLFQVLCAPEHIAEARDVIFLHTHSLGLRYHISERFLLPRKADAAIVDGETIRAKSHIVEGQEYIRPEADALAGLAAERETSLIGLRLKKKS